MRIAILTAFNQKLQPGYSLTGIVRDQVRMLKNYGIEVDVFGTTGADPADGMIPFFEDIKQVDYEDASQLTDEHMALSKREGGRLAEVMQGYDFIFTHDLLMQGWYLPYGFACIEAARLRPGMKWLHWIHSIGQPRNWHNVLLLEKRDHKFIFPNETDRLVIAEQYRGDIDWVRCIPHIKDLRSWFEFSTQACSIIRQYPALMQADVVQVYPASSDKLEAKGLDNLLGIFSGIKKTGASICLLIANQWVSQRSKENIEAYKGLARHLDITSDELIFTSELGYESGLPPRVLRELMQLANLFVYPTKIESFGLVLPEAVLAGGVFPVLNASLRMQREISEGAGLFFDFGAYNLQPEIQPGFFDKAGLVITARMRQNEAVMAKTIMRRKYNWDTIFTRYYAPVLTESINWG